MESLHNFFIASGLYSVWSVAVNMFFRLWYFVVIGIVIGSLISVFVPTRRLAEASNRKGGIPSIVLASLLGVVSPLGSYAVIPIFAAMLSTGVPIAPVMSFLVASPLINPFIFISTWGVLGASMAIARLLSAVVLGILCGLMFHYLNKKNFFADLASGNPMKSDNNRKKDFISKLTQTSSGNKWLDALRLMGKMAKYPGKYFLIAILLAALADTYIPKSFVVMTLGASRFSVLLAAAMSIPFYVCGGGALPIIYGLMNMGMSSGAALAFFIAGPATRISPMVTVALLVKKKAFLIYFLTVVVGGIALGYLYGLI
ncbi:MAG: permease [Elusimicrobiota bacterium]|nr:permease [Elusimicrobiota bacterium]